MPVRILAFFSWLREEIRVRRWARRFRKWCILADKIVDGDAWELMVLVGRLNYQFDDILKGAEFTLLLDGMKITYGEGPLRKEEA